MGIITKSFGLQTFADEGTTVPVLRVPSRTDKPVTLETVVGLPAVFRAIQLITTQGGKVPFWSWRGDALAPRQPQVITKPDPWRARRSWGVRALTSACADGNIFLRLSLDPLQSERRVVVAAPVMNPYAVAIRRDKSGRKVYDHRLDDGTTETLSAEQVEHVWMNEFPGFTRGISPITAARLTMQGALNTRDYAATFFDTGAIPPGVLTSDQHIDTTTAEAMQKRWHDGDPRLIKVMGKGLKFDPILIKPEDAQWIEAQKFTILEHARMWGVPPYRLAAAIDGSSLTYQNLADVNEDFIDSTLDPVYLAPLAAALTELVPAGQEVRHDYSDMRRRDDKTRMETHGIAIDHGIYDAEYARRVERIPGPAPRKDADA